MRVVMSACACRPARHAREIGFGALARQRDVHFGARKLCAASSEMRAIDGALFLRRTEIVSTDTRSPANFASTHMCQLRTFLKKDGERTISAAHRRRRDDFPPASAMRRAPALTTNCRLPADIRIQIADGCSTCPPAGTRNTAPLGSPARGASIHRTDVAQRVRACARPIAAVPVTRPAFDAHRRRNDRLDATHTLGRPRIQRWRRSVYFQSSMRRWGMPFARNISSGVGTDAHAASFTMPS